MSQNQDINSIIEGARRYNGYERERNESWTLQFDHDGTEDMAIIYDASGEALVASRPFWLPVGNDPIPNTLAAVRLMAAAPQLLETLQEIIRMVSRQPLILSVDEEEWYSDACAAIRLAKSGEP